MHFVIEQEKALDKLEHLRHGAIFMSMGTGKTKVAADLAIARQHAFDVLVWIAPASLINDANYREEIAKWTAELKNETMFQSVEGISQSDQQYLALNELVDSRRTFVVVDESSTVKNPGAKRTDRLLKLASRMTFRFILNGTPTSNNLLDLYSQINFVSPLILNLTESQFAERFLTFRNDGFKSWRRWSRPANEEALVEILRPYIVEADLDIDIDVVYRQTHFRMTHDQADAYDQAKSACSVLGSFDFLALAQSLQQIYTQVPAKLDAIEELADTGEQLFVLVKFLAEVDALKSRFDVLEYTGRAKEDLDLFRSGKKQILVATYGTGSLGLNLQCCHHIVFYSQTWAYQDRIQAVHRLRRIGQTHDITVRDFTVETGLEHLIEDAQARKQDTLQNIKKFIQDKGVKAL